MGACGYLSQDCHKTVTCSATEIIIRLAREQVGCTWPQDTLIEWAISVCSGYLLVSYPIHLLLFVVHKWGKVDIILFTWYYNYNNLKDQRPSYKPYILWLCECHVIAAHQLIGQFLLQHLLIMCVNGGVGKVTQCLREKHHHCMLQ